MSLFGTYALTLRPLVRTLPIFHMCGRITSGWFGLAGNGAPVPLGRWRRSVSPHSRSDRPQPLWQARSLQKRCSCSLELPLSMVSLPHISVWLRMVPLGQFLVEVRTRTAFTLRPAVGHFSNVASCVEHCMLTFTSMRSFHRCCADDLV